MRSMTGFGHAEAEREGMLVTADVRSYNNRVLDLTVLLPSYLSALEPRVRALVTGGVERGKVEVAVRVTEYAEQGTIVVDEALARSYLQAMNDLSKHLDKPEKPTLAHLVRMEGVFRVRRDRDEERTWEGIRPVLTEALTIFADPAAELKDLLLTYPPEQFEVLKGDLTNLLAKKWTPEFLARQDLAMLPIMFVVLWCWTGMYLILFLASMQKIEVSILEAARIDGAGEGQVMGKVVLPLLSGVIVNAAILCIAGSLNSFALVFAMTGGGPARVTQLLSIYMYENAFVGAANFPLANAVAMAIVVFSIVLIVFTKLAERRWGGKE